MRVAARLALCFDPAYPDPVLNVLITGTYDNFTTFASSVYQNVSGQKSLDEYKAGLTDQFKIFSRTDNKQELVDSFTTSHIQAEKYSHIRQVYAGCFPGLRCENRY